MTPRQSVRITACHYVAEILLKQRYANQELVSQAL